ITDSISTSTSVAGSHSFSVPRFYRVRREEAVGLRFRVGTDQGAYLFTGKQAPQVAFGKDVKDRNRHVAPHAEADRSSVHDLQALIEDVQVGEAVEPLRIELGRASCRE